MIKELTYNFYYTGPLLFKSFLMKEDLKALLSLCEKDEKEKWNKKLAGLIKNEYKIKDQKKLAQILDPYLLLYKKAYKNFINMKTFSPEVGEFFIFPAGLPHFVNSFHSKGERISMAINFSVNNS